MQPTQTPLARRIQSLRERQKMSRADLAAKMGVRPPSVHDWEHGYTAPRLDRLSKLARVLKTSVGELLGAKEAS